jgi:predicted metal-dependent enzyme (double-stranded beta helix superfamily)
VADSSLAAFIRTIEQSLQYCDVVERIARQLPSFLVNRDLLLPQYREAASDRYRQHILHVDSNGRFSIVALVWKPGQATAIHDHVAWCVVGVYEGEEHETRYAIADDREGACRVRPIAVRSYRTCDVAWFVPQRPNIHRVENSGESLAISIHVYGTDIAKAGNSIRQVYEELPSAVPVRGER